MTDFNCPLCEETGYEYAYEQILENQKNESTR